MNVHQNGTLGKTRGVKQNFWGTVMSAGQTLATPLAPAMTKASSCSLCRKKVVMPPNVYCTDCDFYMAKLKANKNKT
jgi:hypothetical protein